MKSPMRTTSAALAVALALSLFGCQNKDRLAQDPEADPDLSELTFEEGSAKVWDDLTAPIGQLFAGISKAAAENNKKPPLNVTRIEVVRQQTPFVEKNDQVQIDDTAQHLTISLRDGGVVFKDVDARAYPNQLSVAQADRLKQLLDSRDWEEYEAEPATAKRPGGAKYFYRMKVYNQDQLHEETASWSLRRGSSLPDEYVLISDVFARQHRRAHPLSEELNLLQTTSTK